MTLATFTVRLGELVQSLGDCRASASDLLRDMMAYESAMAEALARVEEWTAQANQLRLLNDQKAEEIRDWERRYRELSDQRQRELNRHHELEKQYRRSLFIQE